MPTVTGERYEASNVVCDVSTECVIISQIGVVPRSQPSSLSELETRAFLSVNVKQLLCSFAVIIQAKRCICR